jgi:hypothetical protein
MAFVDFSQMTVFAPANSTSAPTQANPVPDIASVDSANFSSIEWRVIELSQSDGLDSLRPPRARSRLGKLLFGPAPLSGVLANERLDALRRLAVESRNNGWLVSPLAIAAAEAAGFSEAQIGHVVDLLSYSPKLPPRNFA